MFYTINVYESPFDIIPILTKNCGDPLEAESAIRPLTEKAEKIIEIKKFQYE